MRLFALLIPALALPSLPSCVLPPSLSVDTVDAGANSPPAIMSISSDQQQLPLYGTVSFSVGPGTVILNLLDTDVTDTLYVRIFVDYDNPVPTPARAGCTAAGSSSPTRTAMCDITGVCPTADPQTHDMSIVVFDRVVEDMGTPLYQAVMPPGLSTSRYYHLKCTQ